MTTPFVPFETWILAAFDPVLIAVATVMAWKADQIGKLALAVITAVAASVLVGWLIGMTSLPWPAPIGRDVPSLLPVRSLAALAWALGAYGLRWVLRRRPRSR